MIFAPICIPTLNRYGHLRRCLESLSRCTWADQTEVYVALDYPPLDKWDKYAPGWEKNRDWLRSIGNFGFKKLHLIEREENYGIWFNPAGKQTNLDALIEECIKGKYDHWIVTEDDNVFAPCFLEYMNKGYELFKDDPKVVNISGYRFYFPVKFENNTYFRQTVDFSPWGCMSVGINKFPKLDYHWFRKHFSVKILWKLYKNYGMGSVYSFVSKLPKQGNIKPVDNHYWTFMQMMGFEQVTPVRNLVKNIGLDGQGETMPECTGEEWTFDSLNPVSRETHFEFVGTGYEYFEENNQIYYEGKYWMKEKQYFKKTIMKFCEFILGK